MGKASQGKSGPGTELQAVTVWVACQVPLNIFFVPDVVKLKVLSMEFIVVCAVIYIMKNVHLHPYTIVCTFCQEMLLVFWFFLLNKNEQTKNFMNLS